MSENSKMLTKMITNPFITYGYEGPEYFCDRKDETSRLLSLLRNGNHVVLISPRRMGKTGLLSHCFAQPETSRDFYTFLVDIYSSKTLQDFVYLLGRAIVTRLKGKGQIAIDRFLQVVTSLRTGVSFDGMGNPSWNLDIGEIHTPDYTLDEIFHYLGTAEKPCIIAIDEFQQISRYPETGIEALLRTYIQQQRNAVFVFSGSQQSMMNEMFTSTERPFYQSSSMIFLKPVALERYTAFAQKHFEAAGKHIEQETVAEIYNRFDSVTWYIQKLLNELYTATPQGGTAKVNDVDLMVEHILGESEESFKDSIYQLSAKQRDLLVAVSEEGKAEQITSSAFLRRHHLTTASSVQKAAAWLINHQMLTVTRGVYEVYDKFLALWLKREL